MFDLVSGTTDHIPSRPALPLLISLTAQVGLVAAVAAVSLFVGSQVLPEAPSMMAFVADLPTEPPPPPPPPPTPAPAESAAERTPSVPTEAPAPVVADTHTAMQPAATADAVDTGEGVAGGVEGGVPGGVVSSVIVESSPPPSTPPPAPTAPPAPIRVGGKVSQPALVHRVDPVYPKAAVEARLQGTVILETLVDTDGRVAAVKILRSAGDLLDREAIAAVRQWQYAPLEINGVPVRFLLTATLSFKLDT